MKPVIYIRVLKNVTYPICNAEPKGYYFDGKDRTYPIEITHFMACYGGVPGAKRKAECIRKIDWQRRMSGKDILSSGDVGMINLFKDQLIEWPTDERNEGIHVFQLGEKIPIPLHRQDFVGGDKGYLDLADILGR